MTTPAFTLQRNTFGRLVFTGADGEPHTGVVPVRAFPIAAPDEGVSIVSTDGHELAWIDRLSALPTALRTLLEEELASRDFAPAIQAIKAVSTFSTPSTWTVDTDRGPTEFVLKSEDDIRRLGEGKLMITAGHGVSFVVTDRLALDKHSRKLLERFLF
ncbi:hypothetical protein JY96_04910 [Aquabacterium sp. NJ1]|uniref:cyanophycin metabolism-associated DUF1854 family protein n=1 Tax=Aquabacterium sp. NJ1 TaxID=1538295 RepID=UPI00052D188B|nr:DUF1854 domain-containing protein [Aquabacterium sp. NJ1]KGM39593.1 hypothetical protein JY96_04910 [Aquabacterium sp. NJ1]